ncbi:MAG: insulinase family protein [Bacteroidaceae bacterium]|nr:insulinase family protein [Bacteroidaceae bacterium]
MKNKTLLIALCISAILMAGCTEKDYESVPGDPMKTRIYTLDNGLKVYLSVNKDQPRIQTYIAVRVGGKNDPAETTGLSHYFEHIMFKGTPNFGTSDWEAEKPLLDEIETQYEVYRTTTDPLQRAAIYHVIDSLSYKASTYAIANEYDKLMAVIGANGSNAYTSDDVTCYTEDIPSNQIENWAKIQSDRFKNAVIRGFHTELETVYEEYNMSLTQDMRKIWEAASQILFPNHPYGKQTVIGKGEHLKNPSITNLKKHFAKWYVPNNVAICMSGDFDFDKTMEIIRQYFGDWKPNPDVEAQRAELQNIPLHRLTEPVVKEIVGPEAERVVLAWGFPGTKSPEFDYLTIVGEILSNGKAGLFDLDLNQSQKVLVAQSGINDMSDFSELIALALPKQGQTLEEAKELMLAELDKLKKGEFDDVLLESIINNMRLQHMYQLEDNESRASMFVNSFVNGTEWKDEVGRIERLSKITKQDIVDFARKYITDGYACIYKRVGEDSDIAKIEKPNISPIEMNRDLKSKFVEEISKARVEDIQPVFPDFSKDMSRKQYDNGDELLYKKNETNDVFRLQYRIEHGSKADKGLSVASDYITYLGTDRMSAEELQKELYHLACNASVSVSEGSTLFTVSGLSENMQKAIGLCLDWIGNAKSDKAIYDNYVNDILKSRADAKLSQQTCFRALRAYGQYGSLNSVTNIMSADELANADPQALLAKLKDLLSYKKTIIYYGPMDEEEVEEQLDEEISAEGLRDGAHADIFMPVTTPEKEVLIAPYDAKNIYLMGFSNDGQKYDPLQEAQKALFNEYFGGGMNGVVFQEMRESRGLCYSAQAWYTTPSYKDMDNTFYSYIITQNDKMMDAFSAFSEIIENTPESEHAFNLAKEAVLKRLATERVIQDGVLSEFIYARNHGLDYDINQIIYDKVKEMTLDDVIDFQKKNVKGRTYKYLVLGNENNLDMGSLENIAPVRRVSLEEIFGY